MQKVIFTEEIELVAPAEYNIFLILPHFSKHSIFIGNRLGYIFKIDFFVFIKQKISIFV